MSTILVLLSLAVGILVGRKMNSQIMIEKELLDEINERARNENVSFDVLQVDIHYNEYTLTPLTYKENE